MVQPWLPWLARAQQPSGYQPPPRLLGYQPGDAASYSLVLVGPGLWSHFRMTQDGMQAHRHVAGPFDGQTFVLTHHSVIKALLRGDLDTRKASGMSLIAYSGADTDEVCRLFQRFLISQSAASQERQFTAPTFHGILITERLNRVTAATERSFNVPCLTSSSGATALI